MGRRVDQEEDNWYGVTDPKKRKQIQDRLAQRARRRRLAEQEAKKEASGSSNETPSTAIVTVSRKRKDVETPRQPTKPNTDPSDPDPSTPSLLNPENTTSTTTNDYPPSQDLDALTRPMLSYLNRDEHHLTLPTLSIYAALFHNGHYLKLACATADCALITPTPPSLPDTPPSLRPTETQLSSPHYRWIDRFPIPKLRDRMILWANSFDVEEFIGDMFEGVQGGSFVIREGGRSFVEGDWGVTRGFKGKWWFLFV